MDPLEGSHTTFEPASYTLVYTLKQGAVTRTLTATEEGSEFITTLLGAVSDDFVVGLVYWQAHVLDASNNKVTLDKGQITFQEGLSNAPDTFDGRTQAQRNLEAVNAAIEARMLGNEVLEYRIDSRMVKVDSLSELMSAQQYWKIQVAQENAIARRSQGGANARVAKVRFGPSGAAGPWQ